MGKAPCADLVREIEITAKHEGKVSNAFPSFLVQGISSVRREARDASASPFYENEIS